MFAVAHLNFCNLTTTKYPPRTNPAENFFSLFIVNLFLDLNFKKLWTFNMHWYRCATIPKKGWWWSIFQRKGFSEISGRFNNCLVSYKVLLHKLFKNTLQRGKKNHNNIISQHVKLTVHSYFTSLLMQGYQPSQPVSAMDGEEGCCISF